MQALVRFSAETRQPIGDACGPSAAYVSQYTSRGNSEALKFRQPPAQPLYSDHAQSYPSVPHIKPTPPHGSTHGCALTQHTRLGDNKVGIGVILGLNVQDEVVVEDLAAGWPAALSSLLARGDVLLTGALWNACAALDTHALTCCVHVSHLSLTPVVNTLTLSFVLRYVQTNIISRMHNHAPTHAHTQHHTRISVDGKKLSTLVQQAGSSIHKMSERLSAVRRTILGPELSVVTLKVRHADGHAKEIEILRQHGPPRAPLESSIVESPPPHRCV